MQTRNRWLAGPVAVWIVAFVFCLIAERNPVIAQDADGTTVQANDDIAEDLQPQVTKGEGVPLYDDDIIKMVRRLAINVFFAGLVVFVAHRVGRCENDYLFTFLMMNVMVFFICFALKKLELELGMALGLFAIFGIIRYRTDAINVRDMTYLFVVIGLAVMNALSNKKTSYAELVFANSFIVFAVAALERLLPFQPSAKQLKAQFATQQFICDDVELLKPENREKLIEHAYQKLGIRAEKVAVKKIDVSTGTGSVVCYYKPEDDEQS